MAITVRIDGVEHQLWSKLYSACRICKGTKKRHIANGLCATCHARERARETRAALRKSKRKKPSSPVAEPPEPRGDFEPEGF